MKPFLAVTAFVALVACTQQTVTANTPNITGSVHSNVLMLKTGMTQDQVSSVIGAHQHESFDASDGSSSCRSYVYDETIEPKFVHACFSAGILAQASDGHRTVYNHPGDTL